MERRVLLAIFLSFVVLYAYQALFVKPVPKTASTSVTTSTATTQAPSGAGAGAPTNAPATPPGAIGGAAGHPPTANPTLATTPAPGTTALISAAEEHDVRVETPHVIAVFTNRGARLKSWRLKNYKGNQGEPLELVATE